MIRIVVLCLGLALSACGGGGGGAGQLTPDVTVKRLMHAIHDGDCASVKRLVVTPSAIDCAAVSADTLEGIDLDKARFRAGTIEDDSTTVRVTWGDGTPAETFDVQRVEGTWLVVFDSAA